MSYKSIIINNDDLIRSIPSGRKTMIRQKIRFDYLRYWNISALNESEIDDLTPVDVYLSEDDKYIATLFHCLDPFSPSGSSYEKCKPKKVLYPVGTILYIKEPWLGVLEKDNSLKYLYRASNEMDFSVPVKWNSSSSMTEVKTRIWLKVTGLKVERLKEISDEDLQKEGFFSQNMNEAKNLYFSIWDNSIKSTELNYFGSNANPWVYVITFKQCKKPEDL